MVPYLIKVQVCGFTHTKLMKEIYLCSSDDYIFQNNLQHRVICILFDNYRKIVLT